MEVKNCRECGRLFNYIGGQRLCLNCRQAAEDKFNQVKQYIYDHREATMEQVAEENEVTIAQLKQWVREERLCFSDDSVVGIECENCGAIIKTGRFCDKCKKEMANKLGNVYKKPEPVQPKKDPRERARMRFLE